MTLLAMTAAGQLAALLDRAAVTQVVNDWGLFRDAGRWDELRALYARDAEMLTTWYAGDAESFVACTSRVLLAALLCREAGALLGARQLWTLVFECAACSAPAGAGYILLLASTGERQAGAWLWASRVRLP